MKYLVSLFLAIPILASCTVVEEQYYAPGFVVPPPPPPQVEVVPEYHNRYHGHAAYRPAPVYRTAAPVYRHAPAGRVYHGHGSAPAPVVVNPRVPSNVHGHNGNVHGHPGAPSNVHGHSNVARLPAPVDAQTNVHGHNP